MGGKHPNTIASVSAFALPFATVLYSGLRGGAYDLLVWGEVGLVAWWLVLVGAIAGLLPTRRLGRLAWAAVGLFALLAAWTALAMTWGESAERAAAELARLATYLGVFVLALAATGNGHGRRVLAGVTAAVAALGVLALLARLHPAWFPADEAAPFLAERNRLDYPLGYFNGLAALLALGVVLLVGAANGARLPAIRALGAAAVPALALALYFTLSRGGAAAVILGVTVLIALTPRRAQMLGTLIVTCAGSALLIGVASGRSALEAGLEDATARSQGDELLLLTVLVCALVALGQVAVSRIDRARAGRVPRRLDRRQRLGAAGTALVVCVALFLSLGGASAASELWEGFEDPEIAAGSAQDSRRFASLSGQGRYQLWQSAVDAAGAEPLVGIGPGSFEFWWSRNGGLVHFVRDAHSLYVEALAELGVVGFLLTVGLVALILVGGAVRTLRGGEERSLLATATAGCAAFAVSAGIEWVWEIAVLPLAFVMLGALALASRTPGGDPHRRPSGRARLALGAAALVALLAIVPPLGATSTVRASEEGAAAGRWDEALDDARIAERLQPYAASPRLQRALIEERLGHLAAASEAAAGATEAEPTNWRPWAILSRIEARRGRARPARRAYLTARSLNPRSFLFTD